MAAAFSRLRGPAFALLALTLGIGGQLAAAPEADAVVDPAIELGDNADTPPMGFSTWNEFACDVSADLILEMAHAMVDSGMAAAGYTYVNIDDCWAQTERDAEGNLIADTERFPDGIEGLADQIHALGLKLGIYSSAGTTTCQRVYPGSLGYEYIDAKNYYEWGVDYIKYDNCGGHELTTENADADTTWMPEDIGAGELDAERRYERMGAAIAQVQQEALENGDEWNVVFSICEWGQNDPWVWGTSVGGMLWRTTQDIDDTFASVLSILDQQVGLKDVSGPNAWNDPDMLEVGNGGMTVEQYRAHFSLWALLNAPLIAGNDIRLMDTEAEREADADVAAYHDILTNAEVIAVDQDWGGSQGFLLRDDGDLQVWAKPMSDGVSTAIVLLNRSLESSTLSVTADELAEAGLADADLYAVDDLWSGETTSTGGTVRATLAGHSAAMYVVTPEESSATNPSVTIEVTGDRYVEAGDSTEVEVTLHDDGIVALSDASIAVTAPEGWTAEASTATSATSVSAGGSLQATYTLTPSDDAEIGDAELTATASWSAAGTARTASADYLLHLVEVPGDGTHYISDLSWVRSSNTGENEVGRDTSTDGDALAVNGTTFEKGVGTQSPGVVVVYLGGTCTSFDSLVGIQGTEVSDGGNAGGGGFGGSSSTFEVYGDGALLWESDSIASTVDAVATGDIDVTGVELLELRTEDSGGFFTTGDKGNWIEAAVTCGVTEPTTEPTDDPTTDDPTTDPTTDPSEEPTRDPTDDDATVPTLRVAYESVVQGGEQVIYGTGFTAGGSYGGELRSDPIDLGTVVADADGAFTLTVAIPADLETGTHSVVVSDAEGVVATVEFTVTSAASGSLADTGVSGVTVFAVLATLLLMAGAVTLVVRRRLIGSSPQA